MIFEQYVLECLSQASYLVGDTSTGRAVVVDPRRDIDGYLRDAERAGLHIDLVIETHFHADFLSGHLELAAATGAEIGYGAAATGAEFPIRRLDDGERIVLGDVVLEIRATPGHTPESISIVVYEHADDDVPFGVLTGDTLFIGDVGRPDLLASKGVAPEDLAVALYTSVQDRLLTLPDATRVFPGHTAGSACGKNLSVETQSTIGDQRTTNYALAPMSRDEFVAVVTEGQTVPPGYFAFDAQRNRQAHELLAEDAPLDGMTYGDLVAARARGAVVLDARPSSAFAAGHLRGALSVGSDGRFAEYAGCVVDPGTPLVLVTEPGEEREIRNRLARIGFDDVAGYLADAEATFLQHDEDVEANSRVTATGLRDRIADGIAVQVVDVRTPGEFAAGAIEGSVNLPLPELRQRVATLDPARPVVVACASGYRSLIGASWLRAAGFADVSDLLGGYGAWVGSVAA